ncbi:hypothetical protein ACFWBF_17990 [Streptomyces sp. NPDC060028]|uniref:hypothetical protein n=1 Tax=Streptomyces sp. NPDC060028 TaxID=3347041 RepID=UPI00367B0566
MASLEAVYGVLGVLGGATIGAWSAARLQRNAHKSTTATADAEKAGRTSELALETTSTARIAIRAWALFMELAIQDLEAGRSLDLAAFDSEVRALLGEVTGALFRLAAIPGITFAESPAQMNSPLTRATSDLRRALLAREVGTPGRPGEPMSLLRLVEHGAHGMNEFLIRQTDLLAGRTQPTPVPTSVRASPTRQEPTAPPGLPLPGSPLPPELQSAPRRAMSARNVPAPCMAPTVPLSRQGTAARNNTRQRNYEPSRWAIRYTWTITDPEVSHPGRTYESQRGSRAEAIAAARQQGSAAHEGVRVTAIHIRQSPTAEWAEVTFDTP